MRSHPDYPRPDSTELSAEPDAVPPSHERRRFLGQLAGGAAAMAAAACTHGHLAAAPTPAPTPSSTADAEHTHAVRADSAASGHTSVAATTSATAHHQWDLSWTDRLTGSHRQVFDAPEIADGTVLHQARMYYVNFKDVYNVPESDLRAVMVIRHRAIPMVLGDAVWAHYDFIGRKMAKLKDPTTGEWTRRNPFLNAKKDDKYALVWPDGGLDDLIARGAIALACNMAFNGFAGQIATQTHQKHEDVVAEFTAALVPGVTLVPSGIFGVIRAEEGGCAYIRAT